MGTRYRVQKIVSAHLWWPPLGVQLVAAVDGPRGPRRRWAGRAAGTRSTRDAVRYVRLCVVYDDWCIKSVRTGADAGCLFIATVPAGDFYRRNAYIAMSSQTDPIVDRPGPARGRPGPAVLPVYHASTAGVVAVKTRAVPQRHELLQLRSDHK